MAAVNRCSNCQPLSKFQPSGLQVETGVTSLICQQRKNSGGVKSGD